MKQLSISLKLLTILLWFGTTRLQAQEKTVVIHLNGNPIKGAIVNVDNQSEPIIDTTDEKGEVHFQGLRQKVYQFTISFGEDSYVKSRNVSIAPILIELLEEPVFAEQAVDRLLPYQANDFEKAATEELKDVSTKLSKTQEKLNILSKKIDSLSDEKVVIGTLQTYNLSAVPVMEVMSADRLINFTARKQRDSIMQLNELTIKRDSLKILRNEIRKNAEENQDNELTLEKALNRLKKDSIQLQQKLKDLSQQRLKREGSHYLLIHKKEVEEVHVVIDHGYISEVRAMLKWEVNGVAAKVYFTHIYPTAFANRRTRTWNKKYLWSDNANFVNFKIRLSDLLNYLPKENRFFPDDDEHSFYKDSLKTLSHPVKSSLNIGSVIEGRIYTDANGLLNDDPFGIVQTDLRMKVNLNTRNSPWLGFHKYALGRTIFFNHAQVRLSTTKFNSQFDSLKVDNYQDRLLATQMISRSYRQLNFDVALLHYYNMVHFDFNVGYQLNSTRLLSKSDTLGGFDVNIHSWSFEPKWEIPIKGDFLTLELAPKILWVQTLNNGPNRDGYKNGIFNPEVVLNYYPKAADDKSFTGTGFYFRWLLFDNLDRGEDDVMFWQFGYKVEFSKLIKKAEG